MNSKNTFIADKFQNYVKKAMKELDDGDGHLEKPNNPIKIPKITSKEQIYWVCERCSISNPYFLSNCKECNYERPGLLYERYESILSKFQTII